MKRQLPKNVRQIGNVSDSSKIYVEDYVDTFFNQLCEKADQDPIGAFLAGEIVREENEDYIYVYGAIQMKEIQKKGKEIVIPEGTWKEACEVCKQYFGDAEILGWFLTSEGQNLETNHNLLKVHQKIFAKEKSILVLKEAREKEEIYYIHKYRDLMECGGHYIYYEKNEEMQDYMIASRRKNGMPPSEVIDDTATKNFRNIILEKKKTPEEKKHSGFVYALSTFLVLVILVIGATMMNNYDKIRGVQHSLDRLNENVNSLPTSGEVIGVIPEKSDEVKPEEQMPDTQPEEQKPDIPPEKQTPETEPAVEPGEELPKEYVDGIYVVEKGDTLAMISRKVYGDISHVEAICKMNGLEDGNMIFVGQKLLLP